MHKSMLHNLNSVSRGTYEFIHENSIPAIKYFNFSKKWRKIKKGPFVRKLNRKFYPTSFHPLNKSSIFETL